MQKENVFVVALLFGLLMTLGGPIIGASASDVTWSNTGPYVDRIIYNFISSDATVLGLLNDDLDFCTDLIDYSYLDILQADSDISIDTILRNGYGHITINCRDYPLNISAFRRAFAFAFDKTRVTNELFNGLSIEHDSLVPEPNPWCVEDQFPYHYYTAQITVGNQILDAAGFSIDPSTGFRNAPDGSPFDVKLEYPSTSQDIGGVIAQIGIDALLSLHVNAQSISTDFYEYLNRLYFHGAYDMVFYAVNYQDNDIDWLGNEYWSEFVDEPYQNPANFANTTFDAWRDQLLYGITSEEIFEAAAEMQAILQYNVPRLVVYENYYVQAYRNDRFEDHVSDLLTGPIGWWTNQKVHLKDSLGGPFGGTLRSAMGNEPTWFNVLGSTSTYDWIILSELYDSLLKMGPDGTDYSWLAEDYLIETHSENLDVSEGNTRITFNMIDNATWSDGNPLTAYDVAFTMNYIHNYGVIGKYDLSDLSTAYATSNYQFIVEFVGESYWFLHDVGYVPIIPQHIWQSITDPMSYAPNWDELVTSGPYRISDYEPGEFMELSKNPLFFYLPEGTPSPDALDLQYDQSLWAYSDDGVSNQWTPGIIDTKSRWLFRGDWPFDLGVVGSVPIDTTEIHNPWAMYDGATTYLWNDETEIEFVMWSQVVSDPGISVTRGSNASQLKPGMNAATISIDVTSFANPIIDGTQHQIHSLWIGVDDEIGSGIEFQFLTAQTYYSEINVGQTVSFETIALIFNPNDINVNWMPTIDINLFIEDRLYSQSYLSSINSIEFQASSIAGDILDVSIESMYGQQIQVSPIPLHGDLWLWWMGNSELVTSENTIVWDTAGFPATLDPHRDYENYGMWISDNVYETLFTYPWDSSSTYPLEPNLAESVEISSDGFNYTFYLQSGIYFHDGTPFNASAVKYNIERILAIFDPDGPAWMLAEPILGGQAVEDAVYSFGSGSPEHIQEYQAWLSLNAVEVISDFTVRIRLTAPYAPFLQALTYKVGSMISPTWVENHGGIQIGQSNAYIDSHTCGTGPYSVSEYYPDNQIILVYNNNYWRAPSVRETNLNAGSIKIVRIRLNPDTNSRVYNLINGISDACEINISNSSLVWNSDSKTPLYDNINVYTNGLTYHVNHLGFNMHEYIETDRVRENPFTSIDLRRAMSYSYQYQLLIDSSLNGLGLQAQGPIPRGMFGHDNNLLMFQQNLDLAVESWNLAMFNGLDSVLDNNSYSLKFYYNAGNIIREKTCLILKDSIQSILSHPDAIKPSSPLQIDVIPLEWSMYLEMVRNRLLPVFFVSWAPDFADPHNYVYAYCYSYGLYPNRIGYSNPDVDNWIEQARISLDENQRIHLYNLIQEQVVNDVPYIWLYQFYDLNIESAKLHGYSFNPMRSPYFFMYWKEDGQIPPYDRAKTFIWETEVAPASLDPHRDYEGVGNWISDNVYETLLTYPFDSANNSELIPLLAESVEISPDGLNYTFHLRENVRFHDGTLFDAQSVKYNIERILKIFDPNGPAWMIAEPIVGGQAVEDAVYIFGAGSAEHIAEYQNWLLQDSVIVIDSYTVRIRLHTPFVPFLQCLAYKVASMISPTWVETHGGVEFGQNNEYIDTHTCGTGPYKVLYWAQDDAIRLTRNTDYWRAFDAAQTNPNAGSFDTIIINFVNDPYLRKEHLINGEADGCWLTDETWSDLWDRNSGLALNPNITVNYGGLTYAVRGLGFNLRSEYMTQSVAYKNPFYLKDFRIACSYAFDYLTGLELMESFMNRPAIRAQGCIPRSMFGHDDSLFNYEYNLDMAVNAWNTAMMNGLNEILNNNSFTLTFYTVPNTPLDQPLLDVLKNGIAAILSNPLAILPSQELTINIVGIDIQDYRNRRANGELLVVRVGWSPDYDDPDNYAWPFFYQYGTYAASIGLNDPDINSWYIQSKSESNIDLRLQLFYQMQQRVNDEVAYLMVSQSVSLNFQSCKVHGYSFNPMRYGQQDSGAPYFYHMWKEYEIQYGPPEYLQFEYFNTQSDVDWALINGEADLGSGFFYAYSPIDQVDTIRYEIEPSLRNGYGHLVINTAKYPLSDTSLRRAIAFALDKWYITDEIFNGESQPVDCLIPAVIETYSAEGELPFSYYDANLEKANDLLTQAGFIDINADGYREAPNGETFSITVVGVPAESDSINFRVAQYATAVCNSIGINCTHMIDDFWSYINRIYNHEDFDIAFYGFSHRPYETDWLAEEYNSVNVWEYQKNAPNFSNATFDYYADLFLSASSQEDVIYYSKILQTILAYECPVIPVYENYEKVAYDNVLDGICISSVEGTTCLDTYYNLLAPYPDYQTIHSAVIAPRTLNPFTTDSWYQVAIPGSRTFNPMTLLYESLVRYDNSGNIIPWLAEAYEIIITGEGCNINVELPSGRFWHDMRQLTAYDVKFTYNYMMMHECPAFFEIVSMISSIDVLDDTHLCIHLSSSSYFHQIEILMVPILPMHIWNYVSNPYEYANAHPIGSGIFSFYSADYLDLSASVNRDLFDWQMVTGSRPEIGAIETYEEGDYLIAIDYWSGDLPASYTVTIEYDAYTEIITGTITEQDDLTIGFQPLSGFEMEKLHYIWLPAGEIISITVDWDSASDLDIYVWSPSEIYISELTQLTLRRWHEIQYEPPEYLEFVRGGIDNWLNGYTDLFNGQVDPNTIDPALFSFLETQRNGYGHLVINCNKYPFNETAFRRALAFALDKNRIASEAWDNTAVPVDSIIPEIHPLSIEGQFSFSYYSAEIITAKQILDEAGFLDINADGYREAPDGSHFNVVIETSAASPIAITVGYLAVEALLSIGIEATWTPVVFNDCIARLNSHADFDIVFYAHTWTTLELDWIEQMFLSDYVDDYGLNPANFKNSTLDMWIEKLLTATDYSAVETAAIAIQEIIAYECPWILTYQNRYDYAIPNMFNGGVVNPVDGLACFDTYQNLLVPTSTYQSVTTTLPSNMVLSPFYLGSWYYLVNTDPRFNPLTLVYESLLRINTNGIAVPWLASSYSVDVLGGTCDIYVELQQNVLWHDLEPFTANDVAFTFTYMQLHQIPSFYECISLVTSVDVIDSTHLIIHLASSIYWDQIAIMQVPILPMHIWENVLNPYEFDNAHPIGTGPFIFVDSVTNTYYCITEFDSSGWQMVTSSCPEIATIWTDEAGEYTIGVDFYSGSLPMDYTITISYDGFEEIITGTLTEDDIISTGVQPWSLYEIEVIHQIVLPANTEVSFIVDWIEEGDLDIYVWSPSVLFQDLVDELTLQRWHDYYNSPHELKSLETYVSISPSWQDATGLRVYGMANGPYELSDVSIYWAFSFDNIDWTPWELLISGSPSTNYVAGYIDFSAPFGEGYYMFRIEASDVIGHTSSYEFSGGIDQQAPVADAGQDWIIQQWDYFTFNGFGSSDNIEIASYEWTFYDQVDVSLWGPNPTYQFTHEGVYEVMLTVIDNAGHQSVDYMSITAVYDVLPPQITVTCPPSGSTVAGVTTYAIQSEDETGVDHTDVYLDGELVVSVQTSVVDYILDPTTIADGEHTIEIKVYDTFGQEAVTVYVVFTDTEPPDFWFEIPETPCEPFNASPVVSSVDVERVEFWLDDVLVVTDYTDPYVFYVYTPALLDGEHNLTIVVYDEAGNYAVEVRIFIIDTTAPETVPILDGIEGENGWFQSDVNITLQASDLYLGIAQTRYSSDGIIWFDYTSPITLSTDGQHWLYYYSIDTNGNLESTNIIEILIDKPTPSPQNADTFVSSHIVNIWSFNGQIYVQWTGATDNVSGVYGYSIEWSHEVDTLPDAIVDTVSDNLTVTLDSGVWYLHIRVRDIAGNWVSNAYHVGPFKVDTTAPYYFKAVLMCTRGQDGWYYDDVTLTFHGFDLHSGIDYFMYSINSGPWLEYSEPLYFDTNGFYTIRYYCVDNMGHVSEERKMIFGVDASIPYSSDLIFGNQNLAGNYIDSVTVDLSGYDIGDSGFAYIEYSIDDNPWHRYSEPFTVTEEGLHTILYFPVDNAGNCGNENTIQFTIVSSEVTSETLMFDHFTTDSTGYDNNLWTLEQYGPGNVIWEDETILGIQSWDHGYRTLVSTRTFSPGCVMTFTARFSDWDALPAIGWTDAVPIPEIDGPWNYHPTIGPNGVWIEFNWPPSRYLTLYTQSNNILSYQSIFVEDYTSYHTYSITWETDLAVLTIDGVPAAILSTNIPQVSLPVKMLSTSWAGEGPGQTFRLDSVRVDTTGTSVVIEDTAFTASTSTLYIGDTFVDWDGSIWCAWTVEATYDAMLSQSSVFGPMPTPIDVSPEVDGSTDSDAPFAILRGLDGTLWISFRAGTTWTSEYSYVRSYTESGLGPRYQIPAAATSNTECDFVQLSDGTFVMVFAASNSIFSASSWRVYATTSTDMMSWTSPTLTTGQYGRECRVTVDSFDRLYAVVDNNDLGMLLLTSTDGVTWSTPYVAASGHYGDIYYSARYNKLYLAYCNYTDMNIWIKESTDGVSWSDPWLAVDRISTIPGNARICEDSEGRLIVTYRDSPNGVANIYARRITLDFQPEPSIELDWNTGTIGIVHDIKSGDVDNDGEPEIVVAIEPGYMSTGYVLVYNGITHTLERTIYLSTAYARVLSLGDPDEDGDVEILVGTCGWWETGPIAGIAVYDGTTGALEWLSSINNGVYNLWVEDIDADGEQEIIGLTDYERAGDTKLNGLILVYNGKTHDIEWCCSDYGVFLGGYHALANIDDDPALELIFGARTEMYPPFQGTLYIVDGGSHTTQASLSIGPYIVISVQVASMPNGTIRIITALREQDYTHNYVKMYDTTLEEVWSYSLGTNVCPMIVMPGNLDTDSDFEIVVGIGYAYGYWTGEFQVLDWANTQCLYQSISSNAVISFYYGDTNFDGYADLAVGYHAGWSIGKMEIYNTGVSVVVPQTPLFVTEPTLENPGLTSIDGTVFLSWSPSVSSEGTISYYQIQVSTSPAFSTINAEFSTSSLDILISDLNFGMNYLRVRAIDNLGVYSYWSNIESINDLSEDTLPTINHPADIIYEEGMVGNTIVWYPYDENPQYYNLFIDGILYQTVTWNGDPIVVPIDGFVTGDYYFIIQVFDSYGNWISDAVYLIVVTATPPAIDEPFVEVYEVGTLGNTITWHPYDSYPYSYIVYLNDVEYKSGLWDGETITINVDGLSPGEYTFTIVVFDQVGLSSSCSVIQTVIDTTPPELAIDGLVADEMIAGTIDVVAIVTDFSSIDKVEFYIDWELIETDSEVPYFSSLDTTLFADGEHMLSIKAYDEYGNQQLLQITFYVDNSPPELIDIDQSFFNGIPDWELIVTTIILDANQLLNVELVVHSTEGYYVQLPMTYLGSNIFEANWYVPNDLIGEFSIDIVAIDQLGNVGSFTNISWVKIHDYIRLHSSYSALQLQDSSGMVINSTWNDFIDYHGIPLAYYTDDGMSTEILLLSPVSDNYEVKVDYLAGVNYTLSITATGNGFIIYDTLYESVVLNPGDMHKYLVNYNFDNLSADSQALPEILVVVTTNTLYILPGDFLRCQVSWLNVDPGTAHDVQIQLIYNAYLEFVNCTYPVTIVGECIIIQIGTVEGFSMDNTEIMFYMVNLLAVNGTELWLNATLDYHDGWTIYSFEAHDSQLVTVVTQLPENELQTSWWWKNEFSFVLNNLSSTYDATHLRMLVTMISYSSEMFSDVVTLESAMSILVMDEYKGPRGLALRELYSVWLNLANDALSSDTEINLAELTTAGTVGEALIQCEAIMWNPFASTRELLNVLRICQELNAGRY